MYKSMMKFALLFNLFGTASVTAFVQPKSLHYTPSSSLHTREPCFKWSSQKHKSTQTSNYMNKNDDEKETERHGKNAPPTFIDALLEVPDPRLLTGDLLFILIINFLLQIGAEVGSPDFWTNGGFFQPVTMPTTLLAVIVRDSKMSIAWVLAALWNRSYSSSAVSDDETAIKSALQIWVDYCNLRILLELGQSLLFTHSTIDILHLGIEAWYCAIVMAFFRVTYGRFR